MVATHILLSVPTWLGVVVVVVEFFPVAVFMSFSIKVAHLTQRLCLASLLVGGGVQE